MSEVQTEDGPTAGSNPVSEVVVVGGNAGGMTAASKIKKKLGHSVRVTVLEASGFTSVSACGLPYWAANDITDPTDLIVRSPEEHRERGLDVRLDAEVLSIDVRAKTVSTKDAVFRFDKLIFATGASVVCPDIEGIDADGIHPLHTMSDGFAITELLAKSPNQVVILGSGPIGIEMAEACLARSMAVTVIDHHDLPFGLLEPPLRQKVLHAMLSQGAEFFGGQPVKRFQAVDGHVSAVELADGTTIDTDLVVLATGVKANTRLLTDQGCAAGPKDALIVDQYQQVTDSVWAAGDCVAVVDQQTGQHLHVPLGTHANKQGMVAGLAVVADLLGRAPDLAFPGVSQTLITRLGEFEIARTGLSVAQAESAGFDVVHASIETTTIAGYFPGARPMSVWLMADRATHKILGAQIVGGPTAGLRIDAAATALAGGLSVEDVMMSDMSYAPPFVSVWSPLQVAARAVHSKL